MGVDNPEVISALVIGVLVIAVTTLVISVKIMTLLIHIIRRKDVYICPGHTAGKDISHVGNENEYEFPQDRTNGQQYSSIGCEDFQRNNSRTDEKKLFESQNPSMQDPVYHDIIQVQGPSETNLITQRSNIRRSQTTVV
ncbi:uncharacterized protein LOC134705063 [Mytilus trossulus]|uniref:uncharacterized protein LOC134705063 n=1 Tax=Mytilus trossulus TaxID=6551 RepID=UPI003005E75B